MTGWTGVDPGRTDEPEQEQPYYLQVTPAMAGAELTVPTGQTLTFGNGPTVVHTTTQNWFSVAGQTVLVNDNTGVLWMQDPTLEKKLGVHELYQQLDQYAADPERQGRVYSLRQRVEEYVQQIQAWSVGRLIQPCDTRLPECSTPEELTAWWFLTCRLWLLRTVIQQGLMSSGPDVRYVTKVDHETYGVMVVQRGSLGLQVRQDQPGETGLCLDTAAGWVDIDPSPELTGTILLHRAHNDPYPQLHLTHIIGHKVLHELMLQCLGKVPDRQRIRRWAGRYRRTGG